jgi:hypothetical protein
MDISDEIFRSALGESGESIDLSMLQDWQIESIKAGMTNDLVNVEWINLSSSAPSLGLLQDA